MASNISLLKTKANPKISQGGSPNWQICMLLGCRVSPIYISCFANNQKKQKKREISTISIFFHSHFLMHRKRKFFLFVTDKK